MAPLKENNKLKMIQLKLVVAILLLLATIWVVTGLVDLTALMNAIGSLPVRTMLIVFLLGAASWFLRGLRTWILFEKVLCFNHSNELRPQYRQQSRAHALRRVGVTGIGSMDREHRIFCGVNRPCMDPSARFHQSDRYKCLHYLAAIRGDNNVGPARCFNLPDTTVIGRCGAKNPAYTATPNT